MERSRLEEQIVPAEKHLALTDANIEVQRKLVALAHGAGKAAGSTEILLILLEASRSYHVAELERLRGCSAQPCDSFRVTEATAARVRYCTMQATDHRAT